MSEPSETRRRPTIYKIRGPNTWAAARAMFQAGATAQVVAETYDLGISNLHRRAGREGWRKRDLPDAPPPPPAEADPGEDEALDVRDAARAAIGQAVKLVRLGQFARASEAAKAAEMIGRLATLLPEPAVAEATNDAAVLDELRRKILALSQAVSEAEDPVADGGGA